MQKLTNTLLLFFLLLTSVMSHAATYTYTVSLSTGTLSNTRASSTTYADTWTSTQTSPTTLTLKSYNSSECTTQVNNIQKSNFNLCSGTAHTSYYKLSVGDNYKITSYSFTYTAQTNISVTVDGSTYTSGTTVTPNSQTCIFAVVGSNNTNSFITTSSFTVTVAPVDYTITYELDGGTNAATNPATYTIEDEITLASPTKTGYTFKDWTDANGNAVTKISKGTTGAMTLTANWEEATPEAITTITRTDVTPGTWQSFCLPFHIDIDNLKAVFDKIYIPYKGEDLVIYDDLDDATTLAKRRQTARRAAANTTTTTATSENYTTETSTWTDDEEETSTLYSYAYSPSGSYTYDFYITDFTQTEKIVIPQGMPFFAHVKADDTQTSTTVTLTGYLWDEEALTGIQTKTFPVYSDEAHQTLDTSKTFTSIGYLSADTDFSATGAIYAITEAGTMSTINPDDMEQYHAYLMGTSATAITLHPVALIDYDLNGDGLETIADAAYLISVLDGADDTTGKADLNQDGTINLTDLNLLLGHILQK